MTTIRPFLCACLALPLVAAAAPRLIVSTPDITPESEIQFVFDHPVMPTAELGKPVPNRLVAITPAWDGQLLWKAQNVAVFQPGGLPAMGASYRFAVTDGHRHLNGDPIPAGEFATAKAEGFGAQAAHAPNRWTGDFVPATASWQVYFNDEISLATAARHIAFFGPNGERVQARLSMPEDPSASYRHLIRPAWQHRGPHAKKPDGAPATVVVATPEKPLPPLGEWSLIVVHGCPNLSNTARQQDDFRQAIGKIEPFEVASVAPQVSVRTPRRIVIGFTQPLPNPLPEGLLEKSLTIKPRPANLRAERNGSAITLHGDFSTTNRYELAIAPPLQSAAGHPLKQRFRETVVFEYLKPELRPASVDQAQLATGTRAYRVAAVNLATIRARGKLVAGAEAVRLLRELNSPRETDPETGLFIPRVIPFDGVAGDLVFDKNLPLDNAIDTRANLGLKWDELLPAETRAAVLFLDLTGTPRKELGQAKPISGQALVQLTDIGLAWKSSRGDTLLYAFSCATGKPLPGVKLELASPAETLASATTDATGQAWLPRHARAETLRATLEGDEFLTRFPGGRGDATLDMWRFPVESTWYRIPEVVRTVYLFTDRSLYRPGETVRLKGLVRALHGNTYQLDAPAKARLVVVDPTESEIHSSPVTISPAGSFDFTYTLPTSQTGVHYLRLEYPEELERAARSEDWRQQQEILSNARFETEIQVEDFRRNTFEVHQTIADPPLAATRVDAAIDARYYQGQPVAGGKVAYETHITEKNPYPDRFRDFLFGNHRTDDWGYWYHYFACRWDLDGDDADYGGPGRESIHNQAEAALDADGKAAITIPLPESEFPVGRRVVVMSETTDANDQTLTASAETTVHPASIYVGVSRIDRLVRAGEPLELKLVAIGADGAPLDADARVTATLAREVNTSTKVVNPDNEATTHNDRSEETISTDELTITAADSAGAGATLTLRPPRTGLHFLTVRGTDPEGRAFATVVRFHAYGTKDYPWLYEDTLRVKLVSEKRTYQPGDTARVMVLSPIEGTALVTVEREKVLRSFPMELKADQPVIEIPVTEDDAPYACVSVIIVKGAADSARQFKEPQLRAGYCELRVANTRDRLTVELSASGADLTLTDGHPTFRPGAEVGFAGRVTLPDGSPAANAEVTLYAEDEGTLAVMGYLTPDPMKFFHSRRILQVETGLSFDNFIGEDPGSDMVYSKGYDVGGGGDLAKLADLLRKNFDPCAMWAPALVTDADGRFRHTAKLPDLLTRYRVIAVVHHQASRFGHHESAVVANKPLMLEPKAPRFANQGDTVTPRLLVQNASEHTGTWRVTYRAHAASGSPVCRALGDTVQTVTLAPGKSANLAFPSVLETTGEAVCAWDAVPVSLTGAGLTPVLARSLSDAVEIRYPVAYPVPLLRQHEFIKLDQPGAGRDLLEGLQQSLLDGRGDLDLEFSDSPLAGIAGAVDFLLHYPHGCAEQTTSALMPWLAVEALRPYIPALAGVTDERVREAVNHGVGHLLTMQREDGSFRYWPGAGDAVDWATPYVGLGLLLARQNGFEVPDATIGRLTNYLIGALRGMNEQSRGASLDGYARVLWVLALAGKPQVAYQNTLAEKLTSLTGTGRAFLALAYAHDGTAKGRATAAGILGSNKAIAADDPLHWMPYDTDAATRLLARVHIDPHAKETTAAFDKLLNERNPYGHWHNTWCNGWAVLALRDYARALAPASADTSLTLHTPDGPENIRLGGANRTAARSFQLHPDLALALDHDGPAFVRLKLAAKPLLAPFQPVARNGMAIDRFYEKILPDGSAEILTEPTVGDLVRVTLRVVLPEDDTRYLVIEDPLPACFETVNEAFASQRSMAGGGAGRDWEVSHTELRTDRAVFYLDEIGRSGTYSVSYLVRCTLAGATTAPPAKVESMYDPTRYALSASRLVTARERSAP